MIEFITTVNQAVNNFIWGVPAMVCIIGVGMWLCVRTGFIQVRKFPYAIKTTLGRMFHKKDASDGTITPFQAVCTALAGTVGTGNIAGVAGAIAIGGPGAAFWMWCSALLGMYRQYCRCGRCDRHWRAGGSLLDVVLGAAGHVYQVCRGDPGGPFPGEKCGRRMAGRADVLH